MSISFSFLIRECSLVFFCVRARAHTSMSAYLGESFLHILTETQNQNLQLMNFFRCFPIKYTISLLFPLNFLHFFFTYFLILSLGLPMNIFFTNVFFFIFEKVPQICVHHLFLWDNFFLNLTMPFFIDLSWTIEFFPYLFFPYLHIESKYR